METQPSQRIECRRHDFKKTGRVLFCLILISCCIYSLVFIYRTSFVVDGERFFTLFDDAMISMRYAKNLANGYGLVWNPGGERVEGYTNPLWVFFMALFHLLPLSESKISLPIQLSGMGFLLINLFCVKKIADFLSKGDRFASLTAVFLTAFYYPLIFWSLRGMEVSVLVCIVNLSIWLALRSVHAGRPSMVMYLILGIATLVRPDLIVTAISILVYVLVVDPRNRRGNAVLGFLVLFSFVLLQTAFRLTYFGEFLPNTYYLKMTGYPALLRISRGLIVTPKFLCTMIPLVLLAPFVYGFLRRNSQALLLFWIFSTQMLYSVYVGGDAWEHKGRANRFIALSMPLFFLLFVQTLDRVRRSLVQIKPGGWSALVSQGMLAALVFTSLFSFNIIKENDAFEKWATLKRPPFVAGNERYVTLGLLINKITDAQARIAVVTAGNIIYFAEREGIDMLGKADKVIARSQPHANGGSFDNVDEIFRPGHNKWDYQHSIVKLRPDIVAQIWGSSQEMDPYLQAGGYEYFRVDGFPLYLRVDSEHVLWDEVNSRASNSSE